MTIIEVGAGEYLVEDLLVEVEAQAADRWLVRCREDSDGQEHLEGHIVRYGSVYQLRLSGDRRTRLYAPSFDVALQYLAACLDGSMGGLCSHNRQPS